jgi:ATP-dependent Clp protease, protease subunit
MDKIQTNPQANKPMQLLAFKVKAEGETLNLDVYETIGESMWGDAISAKDVLGKLREEKPSAINVRINSGGGDLFDGIAIHNLLRASGAKISVTVDGVAASAASVIAIAADPGELTVSEGAFLMIHEARGGIWGTAGELESASKLIRKANATMAEMYSKAAAKRGVTVDPATFSDLMSEETWLSGEEALLIGLADKVSEAPALAASIDLTTFRKTPAPLIARASPTTVASVLATFPERTLNKTPAPIAPVVNTVAPIPAPLETNMDLELKATLEARETELVALKKANETLTVENAAHLKTAQTLTVENQALKSQNEILVAERDKAMADIAARDAKLLDAEVDALIPNVLDPAERENFVALAKTSRPLFESMIAQRKPRGLTSKLVDTDLPAAESNSAVGADAKFDELVSKDLT